MDFGGQRDRQPLASASHTVQGLDGDLVAPRHFHPHDRSFDARPFDFRQLIAGGLHVELPIFMKFEGQRRVEVVRAGRLARLAASPHVRDVERRLREQSQRLVTGEHGGRLVLVGDAGSGKTTFLNVLSRFIPAEERIVTIADSAELQLQQPHVARLETRPPNIEGRGEVTQRDLVRNSLRMRPDRIVVGEVRGAEALDMLQAMNTGHDGSLTTAHANSPRDMLSRLETMCLMAGMDLPVRAIREQIASAVDLIVQQARLRDGSRKITNITDVTPIPHNGCRPPKRRRV